MEAIGSSHSSSIQHRFFGGRCFVAEVIQNMAGWDSQDVIAWYWHWQYVAPISLQEKGLFHWSHAHWRTRFLFYNSTQQFSAYRKPSRHRRRHRFANSWRTESGLPFEAKQLDEGLLCNVFQISTDTRKWNTWTSRRSCGTTWNGQWSIRLWSILNTPNTRCCHSFWRMASWLATALWFARWDRRRSLITSACGVA